MDFLNVGPAELAFVIVLAILVIGPEKTVEYVQQARHLLARFQSEWHAARRDFMSEMKATEEDLKTSSPIPKPPSRKPRGALSRKTSESGEEPPDE